MKTNAFQQKVWLHSYKHAHAYTQAPAHAHRRTLMREVCRSRDEDAKEKLAAQHQAASGQASCDLSD